MQASDLEEILIHARSNNRKNRITGALVYVDGVFLQVIEGDASVVLGLMDKISRDVRHETVTVLRAEEISNAQFGDWDMAYVSATAEEVAKWAGLSLTQSVPELLTDLRNDPSRAKRVAQNILAVLAQE